MPPRPAATPVDPWASDYPAEDLLAARRPPPPPPPDDALWAAPPPRPEPEPAPEPAGDLMITEFLGADLDASAPPPPPDRLQIDELLDEVGHSQPGPPEHATLDGEADHDGGDDGEAENDGGDHPADIGARRPGGGEQPVRKRKRARRSGRRKRPEG